MILRLLPLCWGVLPPSGAQAQEAASADCRALLPRLGQLMATYKAAAAEDLQQQPLDKAMEGARRAALGGKKEATIAMVGYAALLQPREGSYSIQVVRQVCTLAERVPLPLHLVTCAYFHVLNPLGEADARAGAARKVITRFEALKDVPADLAEHMSVLKACLPDRG